MKIQAATRLSATKAAPVKPTRLKADAEDVKNVEFLARRLTKALGKHKKARQNSKGQQVDWVFEADDVEGTAELALRSDGAIRVIFYLTEGDRPTRRYVYTYGKTRSKGSIKESFGEWMESNGAKMEKAFKGKALADIIKKLK